MARYQRCNVLSRPVESAGLGGARIGLGPRIAGAGP